MVHNANNPEIGLLYKVIQCHNVRTRPPVALARVRRGMKRLIKDYSDVPSLGVLQQAALISVR